MNPCWRLSLFEGARYVAVADFIYSILSITVITLQLINTTKNGVASNNTNIPSSETHIIPVLVAYLILSIVNLLIAAWLYRGISTESLTKCRTFLIIATLSTSVGYSTVIYHGFHLNGLQISLFNSEFVVFLLFHIYKLYALLVVGAYVRELSKLLDSDESGKVNKRFQYQNLESSNELGGDVAKHIIFNMPFAARHYFSEDKFKIDHQSCIEYDDNTSTLKGTLLPTAENLKRSVAVKMLRSNFRTEKHMIALVKEAKLMAYVGHHEHILQFFGLCCTSSETCRGNVMLLMENFPSRRLVDFLKSSLDNQLQNFDNLVVDDRMNSSRFSSSRRLGTLYENFETKNFDLEPFSTLTMIQWAYQLSSAMEYLHSKKVVLGNLQGKSLILARISRIKLTNFSLASELHEANNVVTSIYLSGKISWQWTAMECLFSTNKGLPTEFNERTDVWSYASTLWEIFSMGHAPNMSSCLSEYISALASGERLRKPEFASEGIYKLLITCWNQNPMDRPGFNITSLFFRQLLSTSIEVLN